MNTTLWRWLGAAGALLAILAPSAGAAAPRPADLPKAPLTLKDFERRDFRVGRHRAFIILPKTPAADGSKPWVWFIPTLRDKYPNQWHDWLLERLLRAGFAIAGVDIGESWGNPKGRLMFSRFHTEIVKKYALSPKACLFAEDRGGLMAYNWAAENVKNVKCIGAVYPVCKLTDGPFFARVYDLTGTGDDKKNEAAFKLQFKNHNPLDRLAPLAAAKIPLFHLHGGEDKLVPVYSHSAEMLRRYIKLGGPMTLIVRRSNRHEAALEFFESSELLNFFLAQARPPKKTDSGPAAPKNALPPEKADPGKTK